jgi:hypothetical protein
MSNKNHTGFTINIAHAGFLIKLQASLPRSLAWGTPQAYDGSSILELHSSHCFFDIAENAIFTLKIAFSGVLYFIFISRQHFGSNLDDCDL